MDDGIQMVLDLDCNSVPSERPAIVEHGEKAASHFEKDTPLTVVLFFSTVSGQKKCTTGILWLF